ncbi:hypothetical protein QTI66_10775 [Variovorax sp. J22R133]|uniref:hypothetical protein n=1 Tax=Variovorax brevis TaxID=3053503 RepID=UPI002576762C|nr:hypothetical protein [Variovorax sp. J22R133]MDM0112633.1 hypothetical protein [Variovorax sp. J22R133]
MIVLENFRIFGQFDLRKEIASIAFGVSLRFERCSFDSSIELAGATVRSLEFLKCKLSALNARLIRISDDLMLSEIGLMNEGHPLASNPVDLRGSRISGSVLIENGCHFRGHSESTKQEGATLDLTGSSIEGDFRIVEFSGTHRICNGVSLQDALVNGSVEVRSAVIGINDPGKYAFDLSGANIKHAITLWNSDFGGQIKMSYSHVGTFVSLNRIVVKLALAEDRIKFPAIDCSVMTVEGDFRVWGNCEFDGQIVLRGMRIAETLRVAEASIEMPTFERRDDVLYALDATEIEVGGKMMIAPQDEKQKHLPYILGGVRLDGAKIAGDLIVGQVHMGDSSEITLLKLPLLSMRRIRVEGSLQMKQVICDGPTVIDLTCSKAAILGGNLSDGWGGASSQLRLDGFKYEAIDAMKALAGDEAIEAVDGIAWLAQQRKGVQFNGKGALDEKSLGGWWQRRSNRKKSWIDVSFDPFQHMARAFSVSGDLDGARKILMSGISFERRRPKVRRWWYLPFVPFEFVLSQCYCVMFGYGYSARKAIFTLLVYWLAGAAFVCYGNVAGGVFALETTSISGNAILPTGGVNFYVRPNVDQKAPLTGLSALALGSPNLDDPDCGDQIDPLIYALDVMVPLLDLRQESKCSVRSRYVGWAWGKAIYAAFGALLTSLAILTVSGVLRRDLKQ